MPFFSGVTYTPLCEFYGVAQSDVFNDNRIAL